MGKIDESNNFFPIAKACLISNLQIIHKSLWEFNQDYKTVITVTCTTLGLQFESCMRFNLQNGMNDELHVTYSVGLSFAMVYIGTMSMCMHMTHIVYMCVCT